MSAPRFVFRKPKHGGIRDYDVYVVGEPNEPDRLIGGVAKFSRYWVAISASGVRRTDTAPTRAAAAMVLYQRSDPVR